MILQKATDLPHPPKRIISLVPSQTELLYDLGLEAETIGITKFCVHPSSWSKTINIDKIDQLQPDLIIANKEENVKEQIEQLALNYPVWVTDVNDLEDALEMIKDIGELTGKQTGAKTLTFSISKSFAGLEKLKTKNSKPKTAYLIWRKPYMTIGGDTFINDMLLQCGFENIFADKTRYPEVSIPQMQTVNCQSTGGCDLLLLSSEPYPFKQKHIDELRSSLPGTKIILVDGEFFSWYGSRLLQAPEYFNELINSIR